MFCCVVTIKQVSERKTVSRYMIKYHVAPGIIMQLKANIQVGELTSYNIQSLEKVEVKPHSQF